VEGSEKVGRWYKAYIGGMQSEVIPESPETSTPPWVAHLCINNSLYTRLVYSSPKQHEWTPINSHTTNAASTHVKTWPFGVGRWTSGLLQKRQRGH
jgi:hypothetical protein